MNFPPSTYCSIKNSDSIYLAVSLPLASLLGWDQAEHCIGKSDHDLPCEAAAFASNFIKQDQLAFSIETELVTLDIQGYKNGWNTLLVTRKKIIYENQNCLLLEAMDISHTTIAKYYHHLYIKDFYMQGTSKAKSYILNSHHHASLHLTKKQEICLYFLMRGNSIKQIAAKLNLSPRTIEDHINILKNKFKCHNKQQLIEKAVDSGFLFSHP